MKIKAVFHIDEMEKWDLLITRGFFKSLALLVGENVKTREESNKE
ncbi:MAG: hypothetical protein WA125_06345 [Desulfosporosinus sp.]